MAECERLPVLSDRYPRRFARVLAHLEANSERPASVDELSGLAAFSRYHFHRQFSGYLGMSVFRYMQFMRMRRASWRLAYRSAMSVTDVALASGYEGPEAFARAFRQFTGQSPSEFRAAPDWLGWHSRFSPFTSLRQTHMNTSSPAPVVSVVTFPATRVAVLEHRGNPLRLGESVRRFIDWRKANKLPPGQNATFNLVYDDPDETPPDEFRFGLCVATEKAFAPDPEITAMTIPAGRCALLRHAGSDDHLGGAIRHLYANWLPDSREELRDFPLFMQRVAFYPDVPDSEALTDIYLPLR